MKFVPLSESAKDETVEEARTPRFVPIEEGAKKFVPLNTSSTTKPAAPTPKAPAPTQPAEDFSTTDPMGGDLGSAIMGAAAPREKKVYTGSVFDTQPLPPAEFDPREAERLSNRAYAEATTRPPRRQFEMKATPEAQTRERTGTEIYKDTVLGAFQGGVGLLKGITDNINAGNNPASEGLEATSLFFERLKTPQLRGQAAMRQAQIERARETQGEVAATRVAFNTIFSPAGADVVAKGAGSMIPTLGMNLLGLGVKSMAMANALSNAGDAANQAAEQLKKIKPEEWSNNEVYQTLREKGLSHKDAVAMLVPFYVVPAQGTGFGAGYLSGRTGVEKSLTGKASGTALGRGLSELAGEQVETLAPQFVGNLTAKTVDERVNPFAGLGQAAIETAAGALPGSLISAAAKQGQPTAVEDITPPAPPATPIPPDSGLGAIGEERPGEDLKPPVPESIATPPVTPEVAVNVDEKIESLTQDIVNTIGIPEEDARVIATQRVQREEDAKKLATAQIKQGEEYDLEAAQVETQAGTRGADNVARPIGETAGASASMAGQPSTNVPTQGVGGPEPSGVVYAGQPAPEPIAGEGSQPSTLSFTTAKGSEYKVGADGKTSRTKKSAGKGQGTTYAPHTALYVAPGDHTEILSDMQGGMGNNSVRFGYVEDNTFKPIDDIAKIPQGAQPIVGVFNKNTGAVVGTYPAETKPVVGLHPIEKLYNEDGTSNTHVGNAITEIKTEAKPAGPTAPADRLVTSI